MTDYTKTTNFASKDSLPSGNANKIVKGAEIDTEFNNIATASATKANIASPTFTGTVTIPTADINGGAVDGTTIGASSASSIVGTTIVANTSINIAGDGATVTGIKDEDDMSSNSATKLATQQSIKAYVDSQVTAQDLDVTDGTTSIDIDLDSESLGILGGTGIDSTASGTGVTLAIDSTVATLTGSQTLTNKTLTAPTLTGTAVVASLDISGDVDVDGTLETDALSINGTTVTSTAAELNILDGVTSTAAELNILDGVTATAAELNILDGVNATTAELNIMDGVTATTAELNILDGVNATTAELNILDGKAFLDEDDMSSNSATGIASQQSIKAYVDSQVTAQDLDFQADSGGALSIDLDSETLTFTGGTGIDTSGSGNAVTFAIDSTVATLTGSQTLTNKTLTSPDINTPDIDGGTIDGTVIGGSTAAAGTFTTLKMDGVSGTSPIFELVNNDNEDNDTGRETTLRFSGHRSGGEDVINAQITGNHDGSADDDQGQLYFYTNNGSGLTLALKIRSNAQADFTGSVKTSDIIASGSGGLSLQTDEGTKRIFLADSGNVGIGETAPDNLLHVKKAAFAGTYATDASDMFILENSGTTLMDVRSGTSNAGGIQFSDTTRGAGAILYYHSIDQMYFNTGGNSGRMILNSSGDLSIVGALSKGSGSFKIDHPLPAKADTHHLVHSFVEAPQADNIYRGSVDLVSGSATVNIDTAAGMTDGTFVLLNTNIQCFTSNESGWTAIKGSVSGNTLTITAQDSACTDTISWMVVGERQDQHMIDTDWTDDNGKVIVEPVKPEEPETL